MKYIFTWKDPDYYDRGPECRHEHTDETRQKLRDMGIGEYITLDIDADAKTATVRPPKRRLPTINGDSRP